MLTVLLTAIAFGIEPPPPTPTNCRPMLRANRPPLPPDTLASVTHPVLVHYDAAYSADQLPRAEKVLAALELSWLRQVDELGFRAPVLPDGAEGPEYDVYLIEYQQGAAFVQGDGYNDTVTGDNYNSTSSFMVIDARLPMGWIDSFVAHEFNHACGYATDFSEFTLPIWEGTATAAQTWTLGDAGLWDYDVASFQEAALWPALVSEGADTWYGGGVGYYFEYGAALWVMFLDEKYGVGDGAKGVELWENTANEGIMQEPDAVDAFAATAGTTVGDGLNHLAVVRFLTGNDWDDRGLIDAEAWGPDEAVPTWQLDASALPLAPTILSQQPFITGQAFIDIDLTGLAFEPTDGEPWIRITTQSNAAMDSGLAVLWWDDADQVGDDGTWGATNTLEIPADGLTRIVIAMTNLGPSGWDGDDTPYSFGNLSLEVTPFYVGPTGTTSTPSTGTETTATGDDDDDGDDTTEPSDSTQGESKSGGCGCAHPAAEGAWMGGLTRLLGGIRRR